MEEQNGSLEFVKEIAKYFMDFLETDFHKRKNPKRSVKLRNNDNLLIGLNLAKYPTFTDLVWKEINKGLNGEVLKSIPKGRYKSDIPANLVELIRLQSEKITEDQIVNILHCVKEQAEKTAALLKDDYDQAMAVTLDATNREIVKELVVPFINNIEKSLSNLKLVDEGAIFLMEEELADVLTKLLENKVSSVVKRLIVGEKPDVLSELGKVFTKDDVKKHIIKFFENYKVGDLFSELYELQRNKSILDKQELYLYFCDVSYRQTKYPIFYIPISLKKNGDEYLVGIDSQVYINKKALEFIVQEYNKETEKKGKLTQIAERIIYLSKGDNDFRTILLNLLSELSEFFELDSKIDIKNSEKQLCKSLWVNASNSAYFALFEASDEALINDYEDILNLLLQGDSELAEAFNKLIADFIHKEPKSFNLELEDEWEERSTVNKLTFQSPIPLNGEQLQILSAIKKEDCKYITVEGPPGTGKSHTITAILFDFILNNKSVLVLSDKKEALDVVEDKITETMNSVRIDKQFQNPILRLGRAGNTYSQILSTAALENIKLHYRAVKKDLQNIENSINKISNTIKEELEAESLIYDEIDLKEIQEAEALEDCFQNNDINITDEMLDSEEFVGDVGEARECLFRLQELFKPGDQAFDSKHRIAALVNKDETSIKSIEELKRYLNQLLVYHSIADNVHDTFKDDINSLLAFDKFGAEELKKLETCKTNYYGIRNRFFGYLFKGKQVEALNNEFRLAFPASKFEKPHDSLTAFEKIKEICLYADQKINEHTKDVAAEVDYLRIIHVLLKDKDIRSYFAKKRHLLDDVEYLEELKGKYPEFCQQFGLLTSECTEILSSKLAEMDDGEFNQFQRFVTLRQKLDKNFNGLPTTPYYTNSQKITQELVTTQMTHLLDRRVIEFYEHNQATAKALRNIIRSKQRFPREEFHKLKEAFPCILAGIRDYAEYIPLEPENFDLVIIDEASQVSIAQSFPALLRAKKVLILGDKKQFSNVKAAHARSDTNREYLNRIRQIFTEQISADTTKLVKLEKFNIKTSILDFFEFISNYHARLLKHFRGYKELISYSNKYFYQDTLQVMKIRGLPITDVLKFTFINHDGKKELLPNSNAQEAEHIISELKTLKDQKSKISVGVITPHTNQQKCIAEMVSRDDDKDYFYEELKLKIMTFDTCQGEERDLVFYSMVATEEDDRLWGVFIKNLASVDIEEEGQIKAQRLNVGFSRVKECMNFVLSKPLEGYSGAVGEALRHYRSVMEEAKKERSVDEVDSKSKMEPQLLNWFYQTEIWKKDQERIELIPQFEVGKYLKQLDKTYNHPSYKVDFLLIYTDEKNKKIKIIIEYDGFKEHFKDHDFVNQANYQDYYNDDDLYREKVLEGYGYKFLRVNRFNVGKDPIKTLNVRLLELVKTQVNTNNLITDIHSTIEELQNGEVKECPKCREIRDVEDFKDPTLISGVGRFCSTCKGIKKEKSTKPKAEPNENVKCPQCRSSMVLRRGRYGKFYGCSKYPRCRGTKPARRFST